MIEEEERIYQVFTDAATGLYDRRTMWARLAEEVSRARRYHYPIALLLVTLNAPDEGITSGYMQRLAESLKRFTRSSDILARYSEDTLALLLPCTDENGALRLARRIHQLATTLVPAGEGPLPTLHIGVTSASGDYGGDKVALVEQVEWALRKVRTQGIRDHTVVVRPTGDLPRWIEATP